MSATGGGRWLIYSDNPSSDTFGALNSDNAPIWDATYVTLPPANVTQTGDRYLFAIEQTLTLTTVDVTKTYGQNGTAAVAAAYTATGAPALTGVYLADPGYSGTPSVTSAGSATTASVLGGPYAIDATVEGSSFTLEHGFELVIDNTGMLTVDPAPITVTATDFARFFGVPNPALTYAITAGSLFGTDTLSGAIATAATTTSQPGIYPITQGTLAADSNYTLTFIDGTLTVLAANGPSPIDYVQHYSPDWGPISDCTPSSASQIGASIVSTGSATLLGPGAAACSSSSP